MLASKGTVNRTMLGEVYELVDLFPYFQSAHMLLLKGLRDNDDIKFEKQLRCSALQIADREVLYYLLKNDSSAIADEAFEKTEPEPVSLTVSESSTETQQTVIESAKNSEMLISEIELDTDKPEDSNHDEIIEEAYPVHSVLMPAGSGNEDSDSVVLLIEENGQSEEDRIFYMDPGFSVPGKNDLLELDTETDYSEQISLGPENEDGIKEEERVVYKKQLQAELIDKFIISNPRIEPVRDKSAQPVEDLAKPHTEDKEGFVTETLARIYINQGYYSRAIEIYEKLSLKFPEKSSYFAAQIEKVREYIKK